jgi:alkylation response protein AidB-like acyl-CoA dehydrogenase
MTKQVFDAINDCVAQIRSLGPVGEALGRLDTRAVALLRESSVIRMLQPEDYGGFATHPGDFAEAVMEIARLDGSTGWIAGVIGVPPWELAVAPRRVRDEVWEADADSWVASALQQTGVLRPIAEGYVLNGRWQLVCGIDHCDWALLGARLVDGQRLAHVLVPRADLQIIEDSWNTFGLMGTGGKDVVVEDAIVPEYRVLDYHDIVTGTAAARAGLRNPIYHLPFSTIYPLGISAAVIGMAEGALAQHLATEDRAAAAAAEIRVARLTLLDSVMDFFDAVLDGRRIDDAMRARSRRDQLHAVRRAVRALDDIVDRSGSDAMRQDISLQRFWRDVHMGLAHAVSTPADAPPPAVLTELGPLRDDLLSMA